MYFQEHIEENLSVEQDVIIQDVINMLPVSTSSGLQWNKQGENTKEIEMSNILLTKESEISALKEVLIKWKNRALEAESNAYLYYFEELSFIREQHENELKSLKTQYFNKLNEKEDVIVSLREKIDYLAIRSSFESEWCNKEEENRSNVGQPCVSSLEKGDSSATSSVYDRELEQDLVPMNNHGQTADVEDLESETIISNIQNIVRAIELELHTHKEPRVLYDCHLNMSNSMNTLASSSTLINSETSLSSLKPKRKNSFSFNRIFKKAFPKLYKNQPSYCPSDKVQHWCDENSSIKM